MAFGLTIGTERATVLQVCHLSCFRRIFAYALPQNSIQDELTKRGYSPDAGERIRRADHGVNAHFCRRSCHGRVHHDNAD